MPFWALTILYLWKGLKQNKTADWLLAGLFAGFGFLSKYLFIYLGLAIDIFLFYMIYKKKIDFKCIISIVPFFIVILPHLIWLTQSDYITITYGLHRTVSVDQNFINHITHPLIFLVKQIGILIPFLLMILFLVSKFKIKFSFKDNKLLFLLAINIIPIILVCATSVIMGAKIRTMWMTPFYLFFGVLLMYIFQNQINLKRLNNFLMVFIFIFILSPFLYAYVSITQTDKRTDYLGEEIALKIQKDWDKDFENPINVVLGNEWYAGNLSYHLKSRPVWEGSVDKNKLNNYNNFMCIDEICIGNK